MRDAAIAAVALVVFGWLAIIVLLGKTMAFDGAVRDAIHMFASPGMTRFMELRLEAMRDADPMARLQRRWADYPRISVQLKRAASEVAMFPATSSTLSLDFKRATISITPLE